ncbi:MAG TPA: hypothetical protein VMG10_31320 [Gemmataceae bacterium]|nr:hypothetical protein [Gemmataceae bacterium]
MIEQQPQSKTISSDDATQFQKAVLEWLESCEQSAYTGNLFLQMEFFNTSKTPPTIYKLPKNDLDLLEKPLPDSGIDRPRLLYRSDRQVKALVVRYHLEGPFEKPQIWVKAEPFRDFLTDVDLIERIRRDDFEDDRDWWRNSTSRDFQCGPFDKDVYCDRDDGFKRLAELERDKDSMLWFLGNDAYESQRQMMRMMAQEEHLRQTDRFICRGVLSAFQDHPRTPNPARDGVLKRLSLRTREMTLGTPFVLELHHAPHYNCDKEAFKKTLREALNDFKEKHRSSGAVLEVQDTVNTAESAAWCSWLKQPIQLRLRLTG